MISADQAAVILVLTAALPASLFPPYFAWTSRGIWYRNLTGWALMTSWVGMALLIDISLLYQWLGDDYFLRDAVRLSTYALIAVSSWLTFVALAVSNWHINPKDEA